MGVMVAPGWELVHLTDRSIEIRKDTPAYRRFTDRPGYVRVRGEPGMDRKQLMELAMQSARQNDEELAKRVAKQLMPSVKALAKYRAEQKPWEALTRTPEDPEVIGWKR